jgi:D-glycerate 3-kinase
MHYERLTRWQLEEMPARADIVIPIGPNQRPLWNFPERGGGRPQA